MRSLFSFLAAATLFSSPLLGTPPARPVIIAHRGASGYLPEHTLPAKAYAYALGVQFIEQDLVLTKDDVPVVLHDIEIDTVTDVAERFPERRRADGHFYAIDFTLAELKQLRVTERVDPKTGQRVFQSRFPAGKSSFSISTLEEELQLLQGLNASTGRVVGIYPEFKSPAWHRRQGKDISSICLSLLARYGYAGKEAPCIVQCFEWEELQRIRRELQWTGRLVQLIGRYGGGDGEAARENFHLLQPDQLAEVAKVVNGIGPAIPQLLAPGKGVIEANDVVQRAHALGLVVHPYTFRTDALPKRFSSAEECLDFLFHRAGVDGLFADQPDVPLQFLTRSGAGAAKP